MRVHLLLGRNMSATDCACATPDDADEFSSDAGEVNCPKCKKTTAYERRKELQESWGMSKRQMFASYRTNPDQEDEQ